MSMQAGCCFVDLDGHILSTVADLQTAVNQLSTRSSTKQGNQTQLFEFDHVYNPSQQASGKSLDLCTHHLVCCIAVFNSCMMLLHAVQCLPALSKDVKT